MPGRPGRPSKRRRTVQDEDDQGSSRRSQTPMREDRPAEEQHPLPPGPAIRTSDTTPNTTTSNTARNHQEELARARREKRHAPRSDSEDDEIHTVDLHQERNWAEQDQEQQPTPPEDGLTPYGRLLR